MMLSDSLEAEATDLESTQPLQARWYRAKAANIRGTAKDHLIGFDGATGFIHGSGIEACRCGFVADYYCDGPDGNGKTCDLPICEACRTNVGPELDLCPLHKALTRP